MAEEAAPQPAENETTDTASPPENREAWMAKYQASLARARSLTSDVQRKLRVNEAADAMNKEMKESGQKREKEQLKRRVRGRVREHTEVINDAQRSIKDIEEAITQVEGCQTRLVHMRYARFADLKVCEKRLQLRERRPPRENFRDAVEEALDRERGVLERSRQDLLSLEAEAQQFLTDLQAMRAELSRDTGLKVFREKVPSLTRTLLIFTSISRSSRAQSFVGRPGDFFTPIVFLPFKNLYTVAREILHFLHICRTVSPPSSRKNLIYALLLASILPRNTIFVAAYMLYTARLMLQMKMHNLHCFLTLLLSLRTQL